MAVGTLQTNLPLALNRFVGRDAELGTVKRLISESRLVTLTGAGGIGKTRLAVEVARQTSDQYRDGAWLVELAPLANPDLVPNVVQAALGLGARSSDTPKESLINALRTREMLCVLDNCEHLIDAAAGLISELVRACPDLRILATSREALGIGGEVVWRVPSLSVPDPDQLQTAKALSQFEAVALYCDCAIRATGAFELTDADGRAVAEICNRLDGIPLAIELAASRLNVLTVQELAQGLQESFDVLGTGGRRAVARHQTLRATIGWSYELLSSSEQSFFCRLSVFAGGFTVAAAQAVCMTDEPNASMIDLLGQLVAKSLVLPVTTVRGHGRFRVLEVLRQFGRERLLESADAALIAGRYAEHCTVMAEEWGSKLRGPEQATALDRLEEEHDNIRNALAWSRTSGRADLALRLINAVWIFWYLRGHVGEGLQNGLEVLSEFGGAQPARGSVLFGISLLAYHHRAFEAGERLAAEALDIFDREQNAGGRGRELLVMAAMDHLRGRVADAERTYARALDLLRGAGDDWGASFVLNNLGSIAIEFGRYEEAEQLLSESLDCGRRIGDPWPVGLALANLGDLYVKRGMLQRALEVTLESLNLQRDVRNLDSLEFNLDVCSRLTLACGQFEAALRLAGAAEAARRRFGIRSEPHEVNEINETLATAQRSLDSQIATLAWQEGSRMTIEQAIDYAAGWLVGVADDKPQSMPQAIAARSSLEPTAANTFAKEGEFWSVGFAGRVVRLKDSKGLQDIARLLASTGTEVAAIDLARGPVVKTHAATSRMVAEAGLGVEADAGPVVDLEAREQYRQRLRDLEDEIGDADSNNDPERASRARDEREFLLAELGAAVGLAGRGRRALDPAERARKAVQWRIRDAISRIEGSHPELGRHLARSIRTGMFCVYDPPEPTAWELSTERAGRP